MRVESRPDRPPPGPEPLRGPFRATPPASPHPAVGATPAVPDEPTTEPSGWVRFGEFRLHLGRGELTRAGDLVRLAPQATRLLVLLVRRAGTLVTQEEIRAHLWGSTIVDFEQGVHNAIRQIRTALGDPTESPAFVETVPRRGYRFIAPLEARRRNRPSRSAIALAAAVGLAALVVLAVAVRLRVPGSSAGAAGLPDSYLRARHLIALARPDAAERAIPMMEEAVRSAPERSEPYSGLAQAILAAPQPGSRLAAARRAVRRALEIDPRSAEGHSLAARLAFYFDWDWARGEAESAEAARLAPSDPLILMERAHILAALGRFEEAVTSAEEALRLDPVAVTVRSDLGVVYLWADRLPEAAALWRSLLELHPEHRFARVALLDTLLRLGEHDAALPIAVEVLRKLDASAEDIANLAAGSAPDLGRRYAEFRLRRFEQAAAAGSGVPPEHLAFLNGRLGRIDPALAQLEQAFAARSPALAYLAVDPDLDPLRAEPRFQELQRRMGLPLVAQGSNR
jgi:DNA-binding winged helix-turn-helix (wHTH) protein/Tfp pilus assembly protein PilF